MFRSFHLFFGLICGVVLTSCQSYQPQPLSTENSIHEFESRSLHAPDLKLFLEKNLPHKINSWPMSAWSFEALTLAAFYFHPSLEVARAQWQIARAGKITAAARPNPTMGISPEYNFNAASGIGPWIYGATFDWPIETAGKRARRLDQSEHLSEFAKWNIAATALTVRNNLRATMVDHVAAQMRHEFLLHEKNVQTKMAGALEAELQAGAISSYDATTARIAFAKTELEIGDAQKQFAESQAQIAAAVGLPASALSKIILVFDLQQLPEIPFSESEFRRAALRNRPDILGALSEYAASESALQLEIAKQYPDVHLGTGYQFDQGENKWSLGLSAELPLLNRNQGGISEATARRAEVAARFVALQVKIVGEIDRASANHASAKKQLALAQRLLADQEKQHRVLQAQLAAGEIGRREMWDADLEFTIAQLQNLDALVKAQQAFGELENAAQWPISSIDFSKNPRVATQNEF